MKILITGCQGFIGSSLARYALAQNHSVLGVDRLALTQPIAGMEFTECALEADTFVELIDAYRPDVIFHGAGSASVGFSFQQPREDFLMAVGTWASVLEAVRLSKQDPLIFFPSSASVYGNPQALPVPENAPLQPISPYGFHKVISEQLAQEYCRCFQLNVVAARLFSTIGPAQRRLLVWELFRQAVDADTAEVVIQGTGDETRDFLYIDDVSHYLLKIAENKPQGFLAVNVASGYSTSVKEVAEIIVRLTDSRHTLQILNKTLAGDPKHWQADTALLHKLVDYKPKSIEQGLDACIRSWRA